ncbi:hypothetical protein Leryth_024144 [Lithospermum erythrorhizon]|nr:hypothetical protein Leryth_024144 [Lithospermum erythrorhizon]
MSSLLEDGIDYDILISVSLLDNQEKYYEGTENESLLKDHARSLKNGLRFLGKLYPFLSVDGNLAARVKLLAADVKHSLISYEDENGVLDIMNLEHSYTDVLGLMRSLVINPGISRESFHMFIKDLHQDNYYQGTENGSILKNHARSLKNGLRFLDKLYSFLVMDGNLATRVKLLAADVKYTLTAYEDENEVLGVMKLEHAYADVLGLMRSLVINPGIRCESFRMFRKDLHSMHNYRRIIDLLIENTFEVLRPGTDDQTVAFVKKVRELRMALTYYKPLYRCVAHPSHLYHHLTHIPLDFILNEAARAIYLLLVGKMDEETVVSSMQRVMSFDKQCRNLNMYVRFLNFSSTEFSSDKKGQFYILDNLIHILAMNLDSLNDANNYLYAELRELRTFVESQRGSERLNHYLDLQHRPESICYQAVPIVYSCYMEEVDLEEDMCRKLNDIIISVIG